MFLVHPKSRGQSFVLELMVLGSFLWFKHRQGIRKKYFLKKEVARGGAGEQTRVLSISFIFSFFTEPQRLPLCVLVLNDNKPDTVQSCDHEL
jgi:hypothetical protein